MNAIRTAVIGVGNMGSAHASCIAAGRINGLTLSALCDVAPSRQAYCRERYPEVPCFASVEELLAANVADAVIVAVPHPSHSTVAIAALANGLHVLVEKPVDAALSRAQALCAAAEKSGKVFAVMLNQRTNPLFRRAREIVRSGLLGEIKRMVWIITNWYRTQHYYDSGAWRATWAGEGGGVLLNQAPHNLDLWQWIFGMPSAIYANCEYGKYHDIEVEDDVTAMAKYPNGATGVFITTTGEYPGTNRLEITGSKGKLVYEKGHLMYTKLDVDEREFTFSTNQGFASIKNETVELEIPQGHGEQHVGILKNFTNHLLYGEELLAPGYEGINGLSIANAMVLSAEKGKWVELPNDGEEFWELLQEKIKTSKNKEDAGVVFDTEGSYGNK